MALIDKIVQLILFKNHLWSISLTLLKNLSWFWGRPSEGVELSLFDIKRGPRNLIYSLGIYFISNLLYWVDGLVFPKFTYCPELLCVELFIWLIPTLLRPIVIDNVGVLEVKSIEFLILYRLDAGVKVTFRWVVPFF